MRETVMYMILGYLSGSVLFAQVCSRIFRKDGMVENSKDRNPGAANAFQYGGFWCGMLTLAGDLLKGFLPVFLFLHGGMPVNSRTFMNGLVIAENPYPFINGLVIAAPVIGHAFPVFYGFRGGKGITVTFGCLLGMLPVWRPFAALAVFFIFFSVIFRITPHYHRTLAAYLCSLISVLCLGEPKFIRVGFLVITLTVCIRMLVSKEVKEKMGVKLLWMH